MGPYRITDEYGFADREGEILPDRLQVHLANVVTRAVALRGGLKSSSSSSSSEEDADRNADHRTVLITGEAMAKFFTNEHWHKPLSGESYRAPDPTVRHKALDVAIQTMGATQKPQGCMYEDLDTDSDDDPTIPFGWTDSNRRGIREAFKDCYPMFCTPAGTAPRSKDHKYFYCPCNKHK